MADTQAFKDAFTLSFADPDLGEKLGPVLREYGVAVVRNVFDRKEAAQHMVALVDSVRTIFPELSDEWTDSNMPPGPRSGLVQNLATHVPTIWSVRTSARVRRVFEEGYSYLRGRRVKHLFSSCDGFNLRPPVKPFYTPDTKDWAHLDETTCAAYERDPFACIQGQVVLNDSTGCFRCSPKSVQVFKEISHLTQANFVSVSKATGKPTKPSNWNLLQQDQYEAAKALVEGVGGQWQIPIVEPPGTMILWLSSTVHSARLQLKQLEEVQGKASTAGESLKGWRGAVYVCLQPQEDVPDAYFERVQKCLHENRTTNHWGEKIFGLHYRFKEHSARVTAYLANPVKVFQDFPDLAPKMTPELKALTTRAVEAGPAKQPKQNKHAGPTKRKVSQTATRSASFFGMSGMSTTKKPNVLVQHEAAAEHEDAKHAAHAAHAAQ